MWYTKWTVLSTIAYRDNTLTSLHPPSPPKTLKHHRTSEHHKKFPPLPFNTACLWCADQPEVMKGQSVSACPEIWDNGSVHVQHWFRVTCGCWLCHICRDASVGCRWFIKRFALIAPSVSGARERVRWFIERFSLIALNDSWRREHVRWFIERFSLRGGV